MKCGLAAALLLTILPLAPALAEAPLGDWICVGRNPGDTRNYRGQVSVMASGQTYTVLWRFGTSTYLGTGVDLGDSFAISFTQPQSPTQAPSIGLVLLRKKGLQWSGRWTTLGGKSLGQETWSKIAPASPDKKN